MLRRRAAFGAAAAVVLTVAIVLLAHMGGNVRQQIDGLATANSDSTQWSLAQVDVELLALQAAIYAAETDRTADLRDVRQRFDVLYSRIGTLSSSPLYRALRQDPDVIADLARINAYLTDAVPLIDSSDEELRSALPDLAERTVAIRPVIRQVTLEGVSVLAEAADAQRTGIAETLSLVSILTAALLLVLTVTLGLLLHYAKRARDRAREESLVRSRLASIVATSLDAVLVVGRDGRVIDFNGAAENIFGYARDEAIGARMEDLIVPDHLKAAHNVGMKRYLSTGEKHVIGKGRVQLEARRKNGDVFPVELSISTAASEEGEIFVSFARDISRSVASEQELIKARDDAVAGERAKADLIAVMSHEMRTPLNGMLGTLELLEPERLGPKDAEYLEIMRASGKHLLHHVDNVLEISRVESSKIALAHETFSIAALVRELVESQRGAAEHRGNVLSHSLQTGGQEYAVGDPTRIRQVLLNLVGNAIKFTRNGSIVIEAERLDGGELVEFRVRDTGIGIAEADRERVFEDFVTLDSSYSRAVGGTGLGLAIVKRFVGAMGGEVALDSTPGSGSVFHVRLALPVPNGDPDAPGDAPAPRAAGAIAPCKVLIVEDNRINRIVLRDLLEKDGHQVDEAHDGQQGVEKVKRNSYDLVFMDISMPVLDGVEATRAIRRSEARGTRLPIIALTAHARLADKERFRAAGVDDILAKPISRKHLHAVMDSFLGPATGPATAYDGALDWSELMDHAHLGALAEALGPQKTAALVGDFLTEMTSAVETISAAIEAGATDEALREKVHHAAGSAAIVGAEAIRSLLAQIEDRLLSGKSCDGQHAHQLRETWRATVPELRLYRD
ncbi:ATP-binding protein [Aestuariicoccus sp. MJ-SS9]|uniref:hybrid sensor histidine kinase/response regulator n=1 Tax=Aestuariicoccus sp. MJ-SS9 TaxID=3079855 RepID=UPI0029120237|nr:ATP-binding protein [Aestuariicoccus sp. MJ-SS9]MDU8913698.1 ATP-binding protein [Aestuariicoccus sp. MJ-SS9]